MFYGKFTNFEVKRILIKVMVNVTKKYTCYVVIAGLGRPLFGMLEGAVRTENQSTWSGIVDKLSKLLPYLWPKR